jgi:hypothetical protein
VRASGRVTGIPDRCGRVTFSLFFRGDQVSVGKDGKFVTPRLKPGRWRIRAQCNDKTGSLLSSAPTEIDIADHNVDNIVLSLVPAFSVTGQIEVQQEAGADPKKLHEPKLQLRRLSSPSVGTLSPEVLEAVIEPDGTFKLDHVTPDKYYVMAEGFPENIYVKSVLVGDQESPEGMLDLRHGAPPGPLAITLGSGGAEISGVVRTQDGNKAKARILVLLDNEYRLDMIADLKSEDDGKYSVKGLASGKYKLVAGYHDSLFPEIVMSLCESVAERVALGEGEKVVQDLQTMEH